MGAVVNEVIFQFRSAIRGTSVTNSQSEGMLVPVLYLVYYLGVILAEMPSILEVKLVNSTAVSLHCQLSGIYHAVDNSDFYNVYQKIDRYSGRSQYIFLRDGGGLQYWGMFVLFL